MKYIIILGDGMADRPLAALKGKTPLEAAYTPNLDALAQISEVGLCKTIPEGMKPGSDVANLAVLGYDPEKYYSGRSPLEAASIGVELLDSDVTMRANLVTLGGKGKYEDMFMADYSAGEISTAEAAVLIDALKRELDGDKCKLYAGVSYRHCLVIGNGRAGTELTPPHDISDKPIKAYLPKGENADLCLDLMKRSYEILAEHPLNRQRVDSGKRPANSLWFWGEGRKPRLDPFAEKFGVKGAMISAVDLLKGIGKLTGMRVIEVEGATGNFDTNFSGKADAAVDALKDDDFVYIHMEAPDECGHQGDLAHKIYSIEQIDEKVVGRILCALNNSGTEYNMLVMPDHPTPLAVRTHVSDPVPYLLYRSGKKVEGPTAYDEKHAADSKIYEPIGYKLIEKLLAK